ncbi:glycosyltransferase [Labedella populi]|uniref:Glycosyltransferase n=1 Tax=Labedella populi TaxID=2498850 RepID=A0A3S3ZYX3_9MICO|nr:glycosyltransferase [Labedella populi]RWZ67948.1 glycosyltransferase [Labedella populi]
MSSLQRLHTRRAENGFDPVYYRAQAALPGVSDRAALRHYLTEGWAKGFAPHPAVDLLSVATDRAESARVRSAVEAQNPAWLGTAAPALHVPLAEMPLRVERLAASGLFDLEFYSAQLHRTFLSLEVALWHYVVTPDGPAAPNVLFDSEWFGRKAKARGRQARGLENLVRAKHRLDSPSPHFDPVAWSEQHPDALSHPAGPLGHYLASATAETPTVPLDGAPVVPLGVLRGRLLAVAEGRQPSVVFDEGEDRPDWSVDWSAIADRERVPGRISIVIPTYEDWGMTARAVRSLLAHAGDDDIEIIVVDNGSHAAVSNLLTAFFVGDERVVLYRVPSNANFANGSNIGFALSTGETTVFLNNDTEVTAGWLDPMRARLAQPGVVGVQPLLLFPNGTIQAAGTVFSGFHSLPYHVLSGFPREDAVAVEGVEFQAVTAACLMMRAADVQALEGFDPAYVNGMEDVDLCLRAARALDGVFRVVTSSVVFHYESQTPGRFSGKWGNRKLFLERWAGQLPPADDEPYVRAGLEVVGHTSAVPEDGGYIRAVRPIVLRPKRLVESGPAEGLPSLRWAIKSAAPGTPDGDLWGDTFFADDLAEALRRLGQEVVIDRRNAHAREVSDHVDDVVLNLRGRVPVAPQPGATNLSWIISHPEDVPDEELLAAYDIVYAASVPWATEQSRRLGRTIRPLLQATNADRFHPDVERSVGEHGALFVGRTRKVFRPIVRDALAIGADVEIYGDGWEEFIDPSLVRAEHLDNSELPTTYASARFVLNDHWEDMARLGFLSNRLFDAAATGALIVSDHVAGLEDTFGGLARTYHRQDQLRALLLADDGAWPDAEERRRLALTIIERHSFRTRAVQLLSDVLELRGVPYERAVLLG